MIDLRSDTLTKPTERMMASIHEAELGDDGRADSAGKGEDPTVNHLESLAADITGKEDALFCNSGTMANMVGMLTHCKRGDYVGIDPYSHIYQSEQAIFNDEYFGLNACFFQSDDSGKPDMDHLNKLLLDQPLQLLCLENSFANRGGTCLSAEDMQVICQKARDHYIPVHLDGARIFNAAAYWDRPVRQLTEPATSVQFCLSKGLGAPIGSVLCGDQAFIRKARNIRKLLGGGMRQAGIMAAAGIEALRNPSSVREDNNKAHSFARLIHHNTGFHLNIDHVQTNIIIIDVSPSNLSAHTVQEEWVNYGLKVKAISDKQLRMIVYQDITSADISDAATIINHYFRQ